VEQHTRVLNTYEFAPSAVKKKKVSPEDNDTYSQPHPSHLSGAPSRLSTELVVCVTIAMYYAAIIPHTIRASENTSSQKDIGRQSELYVCEPPGAEAALGIQSDPN